MKKTPIILNGSIIGELSIMENHANIIAQQAFKTLTPLQLNYSLSVSKDNYTFNNFSIGFMLEVQKANMNIEVDKLTKGKKLLSLDFTIPEWVNYIAQNRNGKWWGFEKKPEDDIHKWKSKGTKYFICQTIYNSRWKDTLKKLEN